MHIKNVKIKYLKMLKLSYFKVPFDGTEWTPFSLFRVKNLN